MISIVYKNADFVVIIKPVGVSSQADSTGDDDAIKQCRSLLAGDGEHDELHVINRLDKVVGGLVLLARTKASAAELSLLLDGKITKEYRAVVEGIPGNGIMKDFLYKDQTLGRAFVTKESRKGAKDAELEYKTLESVNSKGRGISLVTVTLKTGRFHQIRAQFSFRKMPLVGDKKYGSRDFGARTPSLFAARLAFDYKDEKYDFTEMPDTSAYPWSLFEREKYKL